MLPCQLNKISLLKHKIDKKKKKTEIKVKLNRNKIQIKMAKACNKIPKKQKINEMNMN